MGARGLIGVRVGEKFGPACRQLLEMAWIFESSKPVLNDTPFPMRSYLLIFPVLVTRGPNIQTHESTWGIVIQTPTESDPRP